MMNTQTVTVPHLGGSQIGYRMPHAYSGERDRRFR